MSDDTTLVAHDPGDERSNDQEVVDMYAMFGGHGWGPGPWIGLVWLAVWALVILGGIYLWRRGAGRRHTRGEEVLTELYARGEIDEDEYHRRLGVVRGRGR